MHVSDEVAVVLAGALGRIFVPAATAGGEQQQQVMR
jgi:hypothetical protein